MVDSYFLYDSRGQCIGTTYSSTPPSNLEPGVNYVKLTYEQVNMMNYDFRRYVYRNNTFIKLPEVNFIVSPSGIYTVGQHNKISVCVKSERDNTAQETQTLSTYVYNVKINEDVYDLSLGEILLLDPEAVGVYVVELLNDNVVCDITRYAISVIDPDALLGT